jgi:hypothetical protein
MALAVGKHPCLGEIKQLAMLLAASAGACTPAVAAETSEGAVDRAVAEVFSQPAFREGLGATSGGLAELLAWLRREWDRLLYRIFDGLGELRVSSPVLFWALLAVLLLVLLALLFHIGWTLSLAFRGGGGEAGADVEDHTRRARRSRELRGEARRLALQGEWREALRQLLLALLALLDERRILHVAQGWTNREILARLRSRSGLGPELDRFGSAVETAAYGGRDVRGEDFAAFDRLVDRLEARLGGDEEAM